MNIDELTIAQLKQILEMADNYKFLSTPKQCHPFIGKFVICRCYSAGVHAGILQKVDDDNVILINSRRLWSWKGTGVALSGVAQGAFIEGKIDTLLPEIYLTGVIEIIPCSDIARDSIYEK
jgi:hypothetical protein